VLIALDIQETSEQALDKGKTQIIQALESHAVPGKQDLNNASSLAIANYLLEKDPLHLRGRMRVRVTPRLPRRLSMIATRRRAAF
jgi:hypothetical protein